MHDIHPTQAKTMVDNSGVESALPYEFAGFALVIFYHVIFLTRGGQTPGKRLMGIKVIHRDGRLLNTTEAITRTVGYYVNSLVFWIGYLWILFDVKKQGWHDKMARSLVVKVEKKKR